MLAAATGYLRERGVEAPRLSAELLLAHVLGMGRLDLYLSHDRPLSEEERARLRPLVAERGRGVSVAHLIGEIDFAGVRLKTPRGLLVPRPETEQLVEWAAEMAPRRGRCVDLGTGTGAIAVALAVRRPDLEIDAVDIEELAVRVAVQNACRCGVSDRVHVRQGVWWEPLQGLGPYDLLVANPPYVDPQRADLLAPEVAAHEPARALFTAPGDPTSCYAEILAGLDGMLAPGAPVLLETGLEAAAPARELLASHPGLVDVELRRDLAGLPRYLVARART